jgi:hypothetical protein
VFTVGKCFDEATTARDRYHVYCLYSNIYWHVGSLVRRVNRPKATRENLRPKDHKH